MRLFAALAFSAILVAQDRRLSTESRLVLVPVTITDKRGHYVYGLDAGDFHLLDNGKPREVAVDTLATGVAPIALVVAVQVSGISTPVLEKLHKIGSMIQPLITGEKGCAAVLTFAEEVNWDQECTNSPDELAHAFARIKPREFKTAHMLDAVHEGIVELRNRPGSRRVLLLISESRDRGSKRHLDDVISEAQAAGVTVYSANYSAFKTAFTSTTQGVAPQAPPSIPPEARPTIPGGPQIPPNSPTGQFDLLGSIHEIARLHQANTAQELASQTGGTTFSFARLKGLEQTINKLGDELHSQYILSFIPERETEGYHELEVRIRRAGDYRVRARRGYWGNVNPN